jgi:Skp family chaperone for outer membrane proteins
MKGLLLALVLLGGCSKEVEQRKKEELGKLEAEKKAIQERNERDQKKLEEERRMRVERAERAGLDASVGSADAKSD